MNVPCGLEHSKEAPRQHSNSQQWPKGGAEKEVGVSRFERHDQQVPCESSDELARTNLEYIPCLQMGC